MESPEVVPPLVILQCVAQVYKLQTLLGTHIAPMKVSLLQSDGPRGWQLQVLQGPTFFGSLQIASFCKTTEEPTRKSFLQLKPQENKTGWGTPLLHTCFALVLRPGRFDV